MPTIMQVHVAPLRRITLAAALALALPAHAADLATKAAPPPAPVAYNWTGIYGGANFGGAFNSEQAATPFGTTSQGTDPSGALGGVQLGYNYQFAPSWLAGIEGEFDWTAANGTANLVGTGAQTGTALSITSNHNWYSTLSGRLGYVSGPWLFYAKGGAAWMNADYQLSVNSGTAGGSSLNSTRTGWTTGGGVEYMLTPRWSAKVEYDYLDFGSNTLSFATPVGGETTFRTQVNEVKVGFNYHF
jgi:opacity protein-like surface antigen